ncbi:MAG: type II toxin-antitoxin system PemK/MazF family toxin [Candidatus Micrarchaeia archaeon]|jgi:mRNA interferase MazF
MEQILRRKDIVFVPFPFSDQSGIKKRPVLIISNDSFNQNSQDVIACGITSNIDNEHYTVLIKEEDWKDGYYSESCVKVASVFTLDKKIILKRIGRLGSERFAEVMVKFNEMVK